MLTHFQKNKGQSIFEYAALIIIIIGTFIVMQKFFARAIYGRWKMAGDAIGFGRLYDPKKTIDCAFDDQYTHAWYNATCFDKKDCMKECSGGEGNCQGCIESCQPADPKCLD